MEFIRACERKKLAKYCITSIACGAVIDTLLRCPGKQRPLRVELHPKDGSLSAFNDRDKALALPILVGGQDLKDLLQLAVFLKFLQAFKGGAFHKTRRRDNISYIYICVCVCVCVCMYVCMDGWMDGWMDVCMYVCMDGCMHGWMHACMHAYA